MNPLNVNLNDLKAEFKPSDGDKTPLLFDKAVSAIHSVGTFLSSIFTRELASDQSTNLQQKKWTDLGQEKLETIMNSTLAKSSSKLNVIKKFEPIQNSTKILDLEKEGNKLLVQAKKLLDNLDNSEKTLVALRHSRSELAHLNRNLQAAIHHDEAGSVFEVLRSQSSAITLALAGIDSAIRQIILHETDYF